MFHEQPFHRLQRNSRRRPWRTITERDLAGIGKTRLQCRTRLPVDHRHLMARPGKLVGGGDADDAGAQHDELHDVPAFVSVRGFPSAGSPRTRASYCKTRLISQRSSKIGKAACRERVVTYELI